MRTIKKWISICLIKACGWRMEGTLPPHVDKIVLLGVPHTSNQDFVMMLMSAWYYKLRVKWVGKEALFKSKWLGFFSRAMGGICVDRSKSTNSVTRIAELLNNFPYRLCLVIAPNGSRKNVKGWRTGFYHIAQAANLPIALGFVDYGKKVMGIKAILTPTGDLTRDLELISRYYVGVEGKYPHIQCPIQAIPSSERT